MQLPASEQLILLSGFSPIKAQKVRYYADKNFTGRVCDPPPISPNGNSGLSPDTPCLWGAQTRPVDDRLYIENETAKPVKTNTEGEGGKDQKPNMDIPEHLASTANAETKGQDISEDDDLISSIKLGEFVRETSNLARAHEFSRTNEPELGMS